MSLADRIVSCIRDYRALNREQQLSELSKVREQLNISEFGCFKAGRIAKALLSGDAQAAFEECLR